MTALYSCFEQPSSHCFAAAGSSAPSYARLDTANEAVSVFVLADERITSADA